MGALADSRAKGLQDDKSRHLAYLNKSNRYCDLRRLALGLGISLLMSFTKAAFAQDLQASKSPPSSSSALDRAQASGLSIPSLSTRLCPEASQLPLDAGASDLLALRDALSFRADCVDHPDARIASSFLALQGAVLRRLGDFEQALSVLERSLMLDADRADALLDFALTKDAMGDRATALAIYRQMLASMDPPAPVKNLLQARLAALQVPIGVALNQTGPYQATELTSFINIKQSLSFGLGYDHNMNAAISADRLRLTFADGPLQLPLAESEKRRAAPLSQLEHRLQAQWVLPQGDLRWQQRIAQRQPVGAADVRSTHIEGELSWTPDEPGARNQGQLGDAPSFAFKPRYAFAAQKLYFGGERLLQSLRGQVMASGEAAWVAKGLGRERCLMQTSFDLEQKRYPQRAVLDGLSSLLGAKLLCEGNGLPWQLFFRTGRDWPKDARPGGMQDRTDLGLALRIPLSLTSLGLHNSNASNQLQWILSRIDDEKGYNPLIENNLARKVERMAIAFERITSINPHWDLIQLAEAYRQQSNLALFTLQGWSIGAQLRRHW